MRNIKTAQTGSDFIVQKRTAAADIALGNQRLEGLEPDARTIAAGRKWAAGAMTIQEAIADFSLRVKNGQVRS